jgi:hypothetical protein
LPILAAYFHRANYTGICCGNHIFYIPKSRHNISKFAPVPTGASFPQQIDASVPDKSSDFPCMAASWICFTGFCAQRKEAAFRTVALKKIHP